MSYESDRRTKFALHAFGPETSRADVELELEWFDAERWQWRSPRYNPKSSPASVPRARLVIPDPCATRRPAPVQHRGRHSGSPARPGLADTGQLASVQRLAIARQAKNQRLRRIPARLLAARRLVADPRGLQPRRRPREPPGRSPRARLRRRSGPAAGTAQRRHQAGMGRPPGAHPHLARPPGLGRPG